jgi:hypothetical protein
MLVDDRVKLLIERMEAFPDEFSDDLSRWNRILTRTDAFTFFERFLIKRVAKKIHREATLNRILTTMTQHDPNNRL